MKITKVSYERLDLKLSQPYTIAYETVDKTSNFILKIETSSGIVGYGCAAPDVEVTQETPAQAENDIIKVVIPFLEGKDALMSAQIIFQIKPLLFKRSSVLAMVDMALMDIAARKMQVPLYQFLGGFRKSIPTSITIGIETMDETMRLARDFVNQDFSILKIKGGLDIEEDIAKMLKINEEFPNIKLRFDGNQGYSVKESLRFSKGTEDIDIEIFEQPIVVGEESRMGEVTENTDLSVMADESLKSLTDMFDLAKNEQINMINIKLMKVGGIREGLHINSVAKSAGLKAMVGCIDECGLGIAAGLHFALSQSNVIYADLDGHLDLLADPYHDLFTLEKGVLYPKDRAGLGVL
jgi:L-alanine-DL-glutamate epimerase-like enolase superfamily enzyme